MTNTMTWYEAVKAVVDYIDLDAEETRVLDLDMGSEYCEVVLRTDWVRYDCYVDIATGEVVGIDTEPGLDIDTYDEDYDGVNCAALLRDKAYSAA